MAENQTIPLPVPSVPVPFYRRWGIVEYSCAVAIAGSIYAGLYGIYSLIGEKAVSSWNNQQSVTTLNKMSDTLKDIDWFERQNWAMLYRTTPPPPFTRNLPTTRDSHATMTSMKPVAADVATP